MVSQPLPIGRTYLGTKDSSNWRESSHPSHSQQSEGREEQDHWAQSESNQHLASQVQKKPWLLFKLLQRFDSVGSGKSHSYSLMGSSHLETSQDNMNIWSVPAWWRTNHLLGTSRASAAPDPKSFRAAALQEGGLDPLIHKDHRPYLQPMGIPGLHILGL